MMCSAQNYSLDRIWRIRMLSSRRQYINLCQGPVSGKNLKSINGLNIANHFSIFKMISGLDNLKIINSPKSLLYLVIPTILWQNSIGRSGREGILTPELVTTTVDRSDSIFVLITVKIPVDTEARCVLELSQNRTQDQLLLYLGIRQGKDHQKYYISQKLAWCIYIYCGISASLPC